MIFPGATGQAIGSAVAVPRSGTRVLFLGVIDVEGKLNDGQCCAAVVYPTRLYFRSKSWSVCLRFGIAWAILFSIFAAPGKGAVTTEYRNKANFLVTFLDFVEWPDTAFASPQTPFLLCVRGDFPFGTTLAEIARTASPQQRRVEVRWIHEDQKLRGCHVVFVSRSQSKRYTKILWALKGTDVLTIGETPDFLEAGGAMAFSFQSDPAGNAQLQFEVSLPVTSDAHLRISSKLLAVAHRVTKYPRPEKTAGE